MGVRGFPEGLTARTQVQTEVHLTWRPLYRSQLQNAKPLTGVEAASVSALTTAVSGKQQGRRGKFSRGKAIADWLRGPDERASKRKRQLPAACS